MTTFSTDPALYIFTSLTAGSSHIVTATSRLETILRANRVPFKAVDLATNQKARMLWGRRAGKDEGGRVRKLPGLVQEGLILGDLVEIEEWNEYGELKQHVKIYYDEHTIPSIHDKPPEPVKKKKPAAKPAAPPDAPGAASSSKAAKPKPAAEAGQEKKGDASSANTTVLPMRSVADEAAKKAKELRLKSLREKFHGKDATAAGQAEDKPVATDAKSDAAPETTEASTLPEKEKDPADDAAAMSVSAADLQSPTSGVWKGGSSSASSAATGTSSHAVAGGSSVQSPTSGRWQGSSDTADLKDATKRAVEAPTPEVAKVESESVIREEPELEQEEQKKEEAAKSTTEDVGAQQEQGQDEKK